MYQGIQKHALSSKRISNSGILFWDVTWIFSGSGSAETADVGSWTGDDIITYYEETVIAGGVNPSTIQRGVLYLPPGEYNFAFTGTVVMNSQPVGTPQSTGIILSMTQSDVAYPNSTLSLGGDGLYYNTGSFPAGQVSQYYDNRDVVVTKPWIRWNSSGSSLFNNNSSFNVTIRKYV
jgi:hypothetical protein